MAAKLTATPAAGTAGTLAAASAAALQANSQGRASNPIVTSVQDAYPMVPPHLIIEIMERRLEPESILKLSSCPTHNPMKRREHILLGTLSIPTGEQDVESSEFTSFTQLNGCFHIYAAILVECAPETVRWPLAWAIWRYEYHLLAMMETCSFASVKAYHFAFQCRQLNGDVYESCGWWNHTDTELQYLLRNTSMNKTVSTKKRPTEDDHSSNKAKVQKKAPSSSEPCHKFNSGSCTRKVCPYTHICSFCLHPSHAEVQCNKKRTTKPMLALSMPVALLRPPDPNR
jgi:hypothetical protein